MTDYGIMLYYVISPDLEFRDCTCASAENYWLVTKELLSREKNTKYLGFFLDLSTKKTHQKSSPHYAEQQMYTEFGL